MILSKVSNYHTIKTKLEDYTKAVNSDLENSFLALKGRIRFGSGVDGERGENISGEFQTFTTPTQTNFDFDVSHTLGALPIGYIVLSKNIACDLYNGTTTHTTATMTFRASATTANLTIFLLK